MPKPGVFAVLLALGLFTPVLSEAKGTVSGTVRAGKRPAAFANVIVIGTRRGALADEHGNFKITEVPAGPQTLRTLMTGFEAATTSVVVEDGKTLSVRIQIAPRVAPKDWHAPRPDKSILRDMARAPEVRLYRLTGRQHSPSAGYLRIAAFDTVGTRPFEDTKLISELIELLGERKSFDNGGAWNVRKGCLPQPDVGVQFVEAADTVDVLLCFECAMLWIDTPRKHFDGNFERKGVEFVRWVKAALPDDPVIQAIREPPGDH